jgi:hypothetical protein
VAPPSTINIVLLLIDIRWSWPIWVTETVFVFDAPLLPKA